MIYGNHVYLYIMLQLSTDYHSVHYIHDIPSSHLCFHASFRFLFYPLPPPLCFSSEILFL